MTTVAAGWANFREHGRLWPALYAVKLILSLLFTAPVWLMFGYGLEHSRAGSLIEQSWSLDVIVEMIAARDGAAVAFLVTLGSFVVAGFLIRQFLNGGLYAAYLKGANDHYEGFWSESGAGFFSHLAISGVMLPVYVVLVFVGQAVSAVVPDTLFGYYGSEYLAASGLRLVIVGAFVLLGVVISEALRYRRAACPGEPFRALVSGAVDFVRSHGVRMYGYYLLFLVPFVIVWVTVEAGALGVTGGLPGLGGVLMEAVLFQISAFVRTGQSLLFTATIGRLFRVTYPDLFTSVQMELSLD